MLHILMRTVYLPSLIFTSHAKWWSWLILLATNLKPLGEVMMVVYQTWECRLLRILLALKEQIFNYRLGLICSFLKISETRLYVLRVFFLEQSCFSSIGSPSHGRAAELLHLLTKQSTDLGSQRKSALSPSALHTSHSLKEGWQNMRVLSRRLIRKHDSSSMRCWKSSHCSSPCM